MRNKIIAIVILLFLCITSCDEKKETIVIRIKEIPFTVECARTQAAQEVGLMFRKKLGKREGMLFIYKQYVTGAFWMKNTSIPLSIAFLSHEGQIRDIKHMIPFSTTPVKPQLSYMYALEVNRGTFEEIGVEIGDYVIFPEDFP
ncbi:MAG: DUF192 domain-containing protein [Spirochaetales bacterium]|nr:DUF192 domain-containing protein [Spirochaetales bacterium]